MKEIEHYFIKLIDRNILADVDPKQLSELVYSALIFEILLYLYDKKVKKEALIKNIKTKIDILIRGYIIGGKKV